MTALTRLSNLAMYIRTMTFQPLSNAFKSNEDVSKYSNDKYETPRANVNFLDRDWIEKKKQNVLFVPSITVNGETFTGDYNNMNELFKLVCSKMRHRPDSCKGYGIKNEKEKILEEYHKKVGEKDSFERSVITYDKVKTEYNKDQEKKEFKQRTTTKADLVIVLVLFALITGAVVYCRNRMDKSQVNQAMHDTVNQQVSQYF
jgi:hypothetical protein